MFDHFCQVFEFPAVFPLFCIESVHPTLSYAMECTFHQSANGRCLGVDKAVPLAVLATGLVWLVYGFLIGFMLDLRLNQNE